VQHIGDIANNIVTDLLADRLRKVAKKMLRSAGSEMSAAAFNTVTHELNSKFTHPAGVTPLPKESPDSFARNIP